MKYFYPQISQIIITALLSGNVLAVPEIKTIPVSVSNIIREVMG